MKISEIVKSVFFGRCACDNFRSELWTVANEDWQQKDVTEYDASSNCWPRFHRNGRFSRCCVWSIWHEAQ